jgi:hypothetical protein
MNKAMIEALATTIYRRMAAGILRYFLLIDIQLGCVCTVFQLPPIRKLASSCRLP